MNITAIILSLLTLAPGHRLVRNEEARYNMAYHIDMYAKEYNISPVLLTVWIYKESSFIQSKVGSRGEIGLGQIHGKSKKMCKEQGLNIKSWRSNIRCTALLMKLNKDFCGSIKRGMLRYASGKCRGTPMAKRIVRSRFKLIKKFRRKK